MKKLIIVLLSLILLLSACAGLESAQEETALEQNSIEEVSLDEESIPIDDPPDTPEEVWGDLEDKEGGLVWDTLDADQQALVNYPLLDPNKVYWTTTGESYHAIDWLLYFD